MVERLAAAAPESVAVVLLHSYADPSHERLLGELISRRLPGVHVSLSHQVVGTFREYERAATTDEIKRSPEGGVGKGGVSGDQVELKIPEASVRWRVRGSAGTKPSPACSSATQDRFGSPT